MPVVSLHRNFRRRPAIRWQPWLAALCLAGLSACASLAERAGNASTSTDPAATAAPQAGTAWLQAHGEQARPADDPALARWWAQLADPTLEALVQQALDHNTDLRSAQASLQQARAVRAATEAGGRPQLGSSASLGRSRSAGQNRNSVELGFSASWEPDWWGQQAAGLQAAQADVQAAAGQWQATRLALVAETGLAYTAWRDAQARLDLNRDSLARLERLRQLTDWRAQAGLASGLDAEQARLAVQQGEAALPPLATEVAQGLHQLALLTGQTPAALAAQASRWPEAAGLPGVDTALAPLTLGVPADLLRRRPDLRAAEASVRAQWARREQTVLDGLPSLTLSGSLGWQAATLAALGGPASGLAAVAANVDWAWFDGGQRQAQVQQQDAVLQQARVAYEAAVLTAVKDVEDSLVALHQSRLRLQALAAADHSAQTVRQLTGQQQAAGLVDLRTLLSTEREALSARSSLQSGQADVSLNLMRLYKALGGGWSEADLAPAVADRPNDRPNNHPTDRPDV